MDSDLPDANNRWFVLNVSQSEAHCLYYLRLFGIFDTPTKCDGRYKAHCGAIMVECAHRGKVTSRCPVPSCWTFKSIESETIFLFECPKLGVFDENLDYTTFPISCGNGATPG